MKSRLFSGRRPVSPAYGLPSAKIDTRSNPFLCECSPITPMEIWGAAGIENNIYAER